MNLKGTTLLAGFCLALSTASGCSLCMMGQRQNAMPVPFSLAPWKGFPVIQFSDIDAYLDDWSASANHHLWPLGLPLEDQWGEEALDGSGAWVDNIGMYGDSEKQRLESLYRESVERSRRAQDEMNTIKAELDQLKERMLQQRDEKGTYAGFAPRRSCSGQRERQDPAKRQHQHQPAYDHSSHSPPSQGFMESNRAQHQEDHNQRQPQYTQHQYQQTQRQSQQRQPQPSQGHHVHRQPQQGHPHQGQKQTHQSQRQSQNAHHTQRQRHLPTQRQVDPEPVHHNAEHSVHQHRPNIHQHNIKPSTDRYNRHTNTESRMKQTHSEVSGQAPMQDVMVIPTRGFDPRDLNIRHHGNSIRVHASRACDDRKGCVSREMETSYKLPFEIERGSMRASPDGQDIVIKGRPVQSQKYMHIHEEEESEDAVFNFNRQDVPSDFVDDNIEDYHWAMEDSDNDSGVFIETEN